jgi:hypothetical protein
MRAPSELTGASVPHEIADALRDRSNVVSRPLIPVDGYPCMRNPESAPAHAGPSRERAELYKGGLNTIRVKIPMTPRNAGHPNAHHIR